MAEENKDKPVVAKTEVKPEVVQQPSIVDHIVAGNMEAAKAAIQKEVVKIVSAEVTQPITK